MKIKKNILFILISFLMLYGCDDLFKPAKENLGDFDQFFTNPDFAQKLLVNAYGDIPGYYNDTDYATDDAVTNQKSNSYLKIATGAWTSSNNPVNVWTNLYGSIQNINLFLENIDQTTMAEDPEASDLFIIRMKGEAYGLRAVMMYYLLRNHGGYTEDGQLMGVPIFLEFQDSEYNFNQPRATFEACMQQIYADLDEAEKYLPLEYNNINSADEIPEKYRSVVTRAEVYNRVMGEYARQLFNGLIARSFRVRASLLAASPAFQHSTNTTTWTDVANNAAKVLDYNGGINLDEKGHYYYTDKDAINALANGSNPKEIIWRANISKDNSSAEENHFPPSLFGNGRMNPTQNLVDAFPMANGYPISDINSGYDPENPYLGRDPRLSLYIIYNGSTGIGVSSSTIFTDIQKGTDDGLNVKEEKSTRTGYYMKKRLRMDVNCNPSSKAGQHHYDPRIRYTEIYLAYAEAANEAWGPEGKGDHSYSAYDVIKAIRKRAGIGADSHDPYLESCKDNKDKMRDLIRNERRLELCFESFRFWDLRRWKSNLNETVRGIAINGNSQEIIDVEERLYQDYMYYAPIPYSEVLKYNNLIQNKGW